MNAQKLKDRINQLCTHVTFDYNGKSCGVDPLSTSEFDMWYGDESITLDSIDEVMNKPFFDGKALKDIVDKVEFITE